MLESKVVVGQSFSQSFCQSVILSISQSYTDEHNSLPYWQESLYGHRSNNSPVVIAIAIAIAEP